MQPFRLRSFTWVWLILLLATCTSWFLAVREDGTATGSRSYATLALLGVAFFKVRLVGIHFMELRTAPKLLRIAFEVWVGSVCIALGLLYLFAH